MPDSNAFTWVYPNWKEPNFVQASRNNFIRARANKKAKKRAFQTNMSEVSTLLKETASINMSITAAAIGNSNETTVTCQDGYEPPTNPLLNAGTQFWGQAAKKSKS